MRSHRCATDPSASRLAGARLAALLAALLCLAGGPLLAEDHFGVTFEHPTRIYAPGEVLRCEAKPESAALEPGGVFDFSVQLTSGRQGPTIWESEIERIEVPLEGLPLCPVSIRLPEEEGTYRVTLQASRPAGFTRRFMPNGVSSPIVERSFLILVFDPKHRPEAPGDWQEAYSFDPASSRWGDRLPDWIGWRRLSWGRASKPVASFAGGAARSTDGKRVVLPPSPEADTAHWQAYPLPVAMPGAPHLVEVEVGPSDTAQQIAITLLDTTPEGGLATLGETIVCETPRWGDSSERSVVRVLCWPRTNGPLLVLSNPSQQGPASYGQVRLLRSEGKITPAGEERTVALDWPAPDLAKQVGATRDRSFADLQTHYETALRVADRVEAAGANGAVIPLPASDAPDKTDLPEIQPLDLLLREFDRRGLRLIPSLAFEAPLPTVEACTPLDPRLAHAIQERLQSLRNKHRSIDLIAVRIGKESCLLLPTSERQFATPAVDRFLKASGLQWPANVPRNAENHAQAIEAHAAEAWHAWKLEQVRSLSLEHCLLLPSGLAGHAALRTALTPRLGKTPNAKRAVEATGFSVLANPQQGVEVALPSTVALHAPPASLRADVLIDPLTTTLTELLPDATGRSAVVLSPRFSCRLIESARLLDTGETEADLVLDCVAAPAKGIAEHLAQQVTQASVATLVDSGVASAGWLDEEATRLRRLATLLPTDTEETSQAESLRSDLSLVVLREKTPTARNSVLVAANPSPWPREARLTLDITHRCLAMPLGEATGTAEWYDPGRHALTLSLAPRQALAWRFSGSDVQATGLRLSPVPEATTQLSEAIEQLKRADRTVRRPFTLIPNPSFEARDPQGLPAQWTLTRQNLATLPATSFSPAHHGEHTLLLTSQSGSSAATSDPFPLPATGQLALLFQASSEGLSDDAQLMVEVRTTNGSYQAQTTVRAEQLRTASEGSASAWGEVIFAVDDLPLDPAAMLQIRFTLTGEGTVRIDEVQAEDLMLPLAAYADDLRPQKLALVQLTLSAERAIQEGRLVDCQRILDSYWVRFLATNFPQAKPPATTADKPTAEQEDQAEVAAKKAPPSVTNRLRSYFPKLWR